jgi:hypothetical protein
MMINAAIQQEVAASESSQLALIFASVSNKE